MTHDYRTCPRCLDTAMLLAVIGAYVSLIGIAAAKAGLEVTQRMYATVLLVALAIASLLTVTH